MNVMPDCVYDRMLSGIFCILGTHLYILVCTWRPTGWLNQEGFNRPSFPYNQFRKASTWEVLSVNASDSLLSLQITLASFQIWLDSDSTYWQAAMGKSIRPGRRTNKWKQMESCQRRGAYRRCAYRRCIQAVHTGGASRRCIQAVHTGGAAAVDHL